MKNKILFQLFFVLFLGSSFDYVFAKDIKVFTNKEKYYRYEMVEVTVSSDGFKKDDCKNAKVYCKFYLSKNQTNEEKKAVTEGNTGSTIVAKDEFVESIGNLKALYLKYSSEKNIWFGKWPIPYTSKLGKYYVVAALEVLSLEKNRTNQKANSNSPVIPQIFTSRVDFEIIGKTALSLPKGFSVLTLEGTPGIYAKIPHPETGKKGWENTIEWTKFLGADAFWQLVGHTYIDGEIKKSRFPWDVSHINMMDKIGVLAHKEGIKYGCWIISYVILGKDAKKAPYKFTTVYNPKTNTVETAKFASISDERRKEDIIKLMQLFDKNPNVDYIGLDYLRMGFGGYEFVDEFVKDMTIKLPSEWDKMTFESKVKWVGYRVQLHKDWVIEERWYWWRAHKMAETVKEILDKAKVSKPVWVFTLGWRQGKEHGQDPVMFIDAGISINSIMLYHCDRPTYNNMIGDWKKYTENGKSAFVLGECLDWTLHQKTINPPGPMEVFDRLMLAMNTFYENNKNIGLFWHDLGRGIYGSRGPYSMMEWMIIGGTSFSKLKAKTGALPLDVILDVPNSVYFDESFKATVTLKNISIYDISNINISMLNVNNLENLSDLKICIDKLKSATNPISVVFNLKITKARLNAGNRYIVPILLTYKNEKKNTIDRIFDFKYTLASKKTAVTIPQKPDKLNSK
ncbi:MAG: hypothetical protein AABY84_08825 [Candidatus Firestonebacteria bacterium]